MRLIRITQKTVHPGYLSRVALKTKRAFEETPCARATLCALKVVSEERERKALVM